MVERASRVMVDPTRHSGIGMTSARTRERLVARLREQGINNPEVLERIAALQQRARKVLRDLRIGNVHMKHGDGFEGWAAYAPFDGIIVAAASYSVPPALMDQLADGGRLVIPVGTDREQQLLRITRRGERVEKEVLGPVTFVPLLQGLA